MRYIALDVGEKRIGVAISDELGLLARPLTTIRRRNRPQAILEVAELIRAHQVEQVVVGLPLTLRDEIGPQARKAQRFGELLAQETGMPVFFWDERFSSIEAKERAGLRSLKEHHWGRVNQVAAAVILQRYLDSLRPATLEPQE